MPPHFSQVQPALSETSDCRLILTIAIQFSRGHSRQRGEKTGGKWGLVWGSPGLEWARIHKSVDRIQSPFRWGCGGWVD